MPGRDDRVLERMEEYCDDIEAAVDQFGRSFNDFCGSRAFQYTVSFCILHIGELAGKLSDKMRAISDTEMNWRQIKSMRNIIVHDYGAVDLEVVWDVVINDVPKLKSFCRRLLEQENGADL